MLTIEIKFLDRDNNKTFEPLHLDIDTKNPEEVFTIVKDMLPKLAEQFSIKQRVECDAEVERAPENEGKED